MTIGFFKDTPNFELTNNVFSEDTLFGQHTVMRYLYFGQSFTLPALMWGAAFGMKLSNSLKAAVREEFGVRV